MSQPARPSRRRFLRIVAGLPALAAWPGLAGPREAAAVTTWHGVALGAAASITIHHPDPDLARALLDDCEAELRRLEAIFSLYRADSAVSRLNRDGRLDAPPMELVELLSVARGCSERTGGAFDVTVQPLWDAVAGHFARVGEAGGDPPAALIEAALARVGYEGLRVEPSRIDLARPGMAITPNGIAQGYVTDRIADRLAVAGLRRVLVDLGEIRALGPRGDGLPWRVGIRAAGAEPEVIVPLERGAVATSAGRGTPLGAGGRYHHLFDPRTGHSPHRYDAVSVTAPRATLADALSTGFSALPEREIRAALAGLAGVTVRLFAGGTVRLLRA